MFTFNCQCTQGVRDREEQVAFVYVAGDCLELRSVVVKGAKGQRARGRGGSGSKEYPGDSKKLLVGMVGH